MTRPGAVRLTGEIDAESYELLIQQALDRNMTIPAYTAFLVRRAVRVPTSDEQATSLVHLGGSAGGHP